MTKLLCIIIAALSIFSYTQYRDLEVKGVEYAALQQKYSSVLEENSNLLKSQDQTKRTNEKLIQEIGLQNDAINAAEAIAKKYELAAQKAKQELEKIRKQGFDYVTINVSKSAEENMDYLRKAAQELSKFEPKVE